MVTRLPFLSACWCWTRTISMVTMPLGLTVSPLGEGSEVTLLGGRARPGPGSV